MGGRIREGLMGGGGGGAVGAVFRYMTGKNDMGMFPTLLCSYSPHFGFLWHSVLVFLRCSRASSFFLLCLFGGSCFMLVAFINLL